jgi:alpha,alpha-trehalase
MDDWDLLYTGFDPEREGLRETLTTLGNGYVATRGAWPNAEADGTHYPGTYLAGGYNRLCSEIEGHAIENEDLVNLPNWLVLVLRIGDGPWLRPGVLGILELRQRLALREGLLTRTMLVEDPEGRRLRLEECRLVSMDDPHLAALSLRITPEGWSGPVTIRSAIDGGVRNAGVPRYGALSGRHLETVETGEADGGIVMLRSRMVQSRREVAVAARTILYRGPLPVAAGRTLAQAGDLVAHDLHLDLEDGVRIEVEKVVAIHTSRDAAISEPAAASLEALRRAPRVDRLREAHARAWSDRWRTCGIEIEAPGEPGVQARLNLNLFHLLQTVSVHSVDLDIGIPPRGWTGEAYRGHVMWDELFVFPYLNLREHVLGRALLLYRYRRLGAARRAARDAGHAGAMFPWQSGSDGREESQKIHLNPLSGRWVPDVSRRQRHVGAAIAYNVWQYWQVTQDREFLHDYGAELMLSIAQFWSSLARRDEATGRFSISGVMGPDEFHTGDPDAPPGTESGLVDNAYTNVMAAWVLTRTLDVLDLVPAERRTALCARLGIEEDEIARWDAISRGLTVPMMEDGMISQFRGYGDLAELDWDRYRGEYGRIQRLDRILEREGANPNRYKVSKQADVLMLFYLFSAEELTEIFERLGYAFDPRMIPATIRYYLARTSHGSTLSWITHAWVLSRADRPRSWQLFCQALDSDLADLQGGTTREGIHLGAMAGTVDLVQRCFTGIETRGNMLTFNPCLPPELERLKTTVRYRGQTLDILVTPTSLHIRSRRLTAHPVTIAYRGHVREISPGQGFDFTLLDRRVPKDGSAAPG